MMATVDSRGGYLYQHCPQLGLPADFLSDVEQWLWVLFQSDKNAALKAAAAGG